MKVRSSSLSPFAVRGIAVMCAGVFVASAHTARADSPPPPTGTPTAASTLTATITPTSTVTRTPTSTVTGTPPTPTPTTPTVENVWTSHGPGVVPVPAIAVDPSTPSTLYAATDGGNGGAVYKSTDGGGSWNAATGLPGARALVFDPSTPGSLYAGIAGRCPEFDCIPGGVCRSTDSGDASWQCTNLPVGAVVTFAIDPITTSTLYAGTTPFCATKEGGCIGGGVFMSTNGGGSWRAANAGLPDTTYVSALAIDPSRPSTLYAGSEYNGFKSTDSATTWQTLLGGLPDATYFGAFAIDPSIPSTIYAGTAVGAFKSTDSGGSWSAASTGLPDNISVNALAIDPTTPSTLDAGTQGGGVFKSTDAGGTWGPFNTGLTYTSISVLAFDPLAPSTLYAGTDGGVFSIQQAPAAKVVGTGTAASCTDAALNTALAGGGLVTFNCGPASVTVDISTGTGTKMIATDTTIDGRGLITISGGNAVGLFSVESSVNFAVENLSIANGRSASFVGGGIANDSGTLTVTNCIFSGNGTEGSGSGGGIHNDSGSVTVSNSTFTNNHSGYGGAITSNGGSVTVTNSTFTGNTAGRGGGIYNNGTGLLSVRSTTFTDNHTFGVEGPAGPGGGIANCGSGSVSVSNTTFTGNGAGDGGGIANCGSGSLRVSNSTFTGNCGSSGDFCGVGDGISNDTGGTALLRNNIVANSAIGNCSGTITDGGHNLDDGTSCGFSVANGSLSNTNPQLDPAGLQSNGGPTQTVALCTAVGVPAGCTAASPAIDAGDQAVCAAAPVKNHDQRGFVRPGSGHTNCSIGAYEADGTAPACTGDCDGKGDVTVDEIIILVNIALGNAQPAACARGVPSGADVDVTLIIQAVNNALNGCGAGK